jgi:hypothetical protein
VKKRRKESHMGIVKEVMKGRRKENHEGMGEIL